MSDHLSQSALTKQGRR
ncbi:hypothetical protein YPPY88_1990, partial [Yersinia pestis PY-88]